MFEWTDVLLSLVLSALCGRLYYAGNVKARDADDADLTVRQKRRKQKLQQKERWEILASACGYGLSLFCLFIFLGATNFSHLPALNSFLIQLSFLLFVLTFPSAAVFIVKIFRRKQHR